MSPVMLKKSPDQTDPIACNMSREREQMGIVVNRGVKI